MPYNSAGTSFVSRAVVPILQPSVKEGTLDYPSGTTAQLTANAAWTSVSVTSTATLVEAAKNRTKGIVFAVPTDQPPVAFANLNTLVAGQGLPIQAVSQTFATTGAVGFTVPPGISVSVTPCNDAIYAITPSGFSATIFFQDI